MVTNCSGVGWGGDIGGTSQFVRQWGGGGGGGGGTLAGQVNF